jgi:enoyl-CoA hydratase/carnithine racemase
MTAGRKAKLFATERSDEIQVIRFEHNQLVQANDLENGRMLLEFLDSVSSDITIKVVILLGCPDNFSKPEATDFFKRMMVPEHEECLAQIIASMDRIVCKLMSLNQFVIHCSRSDVWGPFYNISMVCDYRVASSQTVLKFSSFELGLLPKDGHTHLGRCKAWQLLLSEEGIDAYKAQAMGLVDLVLPSEYLVEDAMNFARLLCKAPLQLIRTAKHLLTNNRTDYVNAFSDYDVARASIERAMRGCDGRIRQHRQTPGKRANMMRDGLLDT